MLEARCPKCGYHYCGWALTNPEYQTCPNCGTKLEVYQEKRENKEANGHKKRGRGI